MNAGSEKQDPAYVRLFSSALLCALCVFCVQALAQQQQWVASWVASAHGPYPVGNAVAQPELKFAFPAARDGAANQTFRLIVRPDLWGERWRIRLTNLFGTQPVTFDAKVGR